MLTAARAAAAQACRNRAAHLRGHVYVQYFATDSAVRAAQALDGRWYDARPVRAQPMPRRALAVAEGQRLAVRSGAAAARARSCVAGCHLRAVCARHVPAGRAVQLHASLPRPVRGASLLLSLLLSPLPPRRRLPRCCCHHCRPPPPDSLLVVATHTELPAGRPRRESRPPHARNSRHRVRCGCSHRGCSSSRCSSGVRRGRAAEAELGPWQQSLAQSRA